MSELLRNAWLGWGRFTDDGKLAALLLAVLLFLWFGGRVKAQKALILYTTVLAVCCIIPVTAALLMIYQTKFYDYEWIWSMVPLTAVTAYGMTLFLAESWGEFKAGNWKKGIPATLLAVAALVFCGSMGGKVQSEASEAGRKEQRQQVLAVVEALNRLVDEKAAEPGGDGAICLWAPREVMEYAREADAGIQLIYGRNMWDMSLNGYAYDVYTEETEQLYLWMEFVEDFCTEEYTVVEWKAENEIKAKENRELALLSFESCMENAQIYGVNCILLPGDAEQDILERFTKAFGVEAQLLEGYWVFYE